MIRHPDVRRVREAQSQLARAGVPANACPGPYRPAPDGEDIAIWACDDAHAGAVDVGAARASTSTPLCCLAGYSLAAPPPIGLSPSRIGFDGAIALDAPEPMLSAQVQALIRIAVAEDECVRRAATAAALGAAKPRRAEPGVLKALFIGAPDPTFLALQHALKAHGAIAAAFSSFAGFDHLHDEQFDAVVLNGASDAATALSLCAALRRNATLYHLPTLFVSAAGDPRSATIAIERGAAAAVAANAPLGPSLGWLFEAIRRERRRRTVEDELAALRDLMGEARTGLFRPDAFAAHLARLADDHHASGRSLALTALRVLPAHGARAPSAEAWRKGFDEIASLASQLVRAADSGATIGADTIAVALPAADLDAARRTAERIASVAECTAFAANEDSAGPLVLEQNALELQPGESGAGLLARALRGFEADLARA